MRTTGKAWMTGISQDKPGQGDLELSPGRPQTTEFAQPDSRLAA